MSINFQTFLNQTGFTSAYAARKILYFSRSRPALLAKTLNLNIEACRSQMVQAVNGSLKFEETKTCASSKPASPQIDLIEDTDATTSGRAA